MPSIDEIQLIIHFFKIEPKEILKDITTMNINNSGNNVQIGFLNNTMEYTNNNTNDEILNKIQKLFQGVIHFIPFFLINVTLQLKQFFYSCALFLSKITPIRVPAFFSLNFVH